MQAKVKQDGQIFLVQLEGVVDYDSSEPFRKTLLDHMIGKPVVFNLKELSFVGSNGITPFLSAIKALCEAKHSEVRFCHVGSEFQRIFEANGILIDINFEDEVQALNSIRFASPIEMPADFEESTPTAASVPSLNPKGNQDIP